MTTDTRDEYGFGPLTTEQIEVAEFTLDSLLRIALKETPTGRVPSDSIVGQRVKALAYGIKHRNVSGLTLRELAKKSGVSHPMFVRAIAHVEKESSVKFHKMPC